MNAIYSSGKVHVLMMYTCQWRDRQTHVDAEETDTMDPAYVNEEERVVTMLWMWLKEKKQRHIDVAVAMLHHLNNDAAWSVVYNKKNK